MKCDWIHSSLSDTSKPLHGEERRYNFEEGLLCFDAISEVNMNPRCAGESIDSSRRCGTYCKSNYQHTEQTMLIHKLRCTLLRGLY